MNIAWILLYTLITNGLKIVIFFKVDGIGLNFERIFKAFLFKLLLAVVFVMISYIVGNDYLSYFMEPLYGIGLSFLLLRGLPKKLLFFYGLFPMILVNLFYRGVSYFVLPFLGQVIVDKGSNPIFLLMTIFVCFIVLVFLKWLDYDFTNLRKEILDKGFQKSLTTINWIMGGYYLVMQTLSFFEYEQGIQSTTFTQPLLEEILFRGIILGSLEKYSHIVAIILSAVLFGFAHDGEMLSQHLVSGIVLGILYIKRRNLYSCVVVHGLMNATVTCLFFLAT